MSLTTDLCICDGSSQSAGGGYVEYILEPNPDCLEHFPIVEEDTLEDEYEWTPYCWDDCEMCGCHGLCDGEPWDEDIDYEEEDE